MRKFKTLLIAAAFVFAGASAFAAEATVTYVSGKVEVQRNGKWVALQKGDSVAKEETINTGFQSEAKIKMMDTVLYLGPVTRITLEELASTDQDDTVNVYLKTGTTRSQVRHADNKRVNYQVHTAVAVASCRGTDWIMSDANIVKCLGGIVAVSAYRGFSGISAFLNSYTGKNRPSSKDGVLVFGNQVVNVSDLRMVSFPENDLVNLINEVVTTVSSEGEKESVGGAGIGGNFGGGSEGAAPKEAVVVIKLDIPF